ncbi:hypothetical protein FRC02_003100 [Tulasnella sp. 418]|nr:hypothetical protein FRC02_003100 [Tulasnella sp. 418]
MVTNVFESVAIGHDLERATSLRGGTSVGSLPSCNCSDPTLRANIAKSQYQYPVIGAGAGGGTVAALLADDGYTVCLIEAGKGDIFDKVSRTT